MGSQAARNLWKRYLMHGSEEFLVLQKPAIKLHDYYPCRGGEGGTAGPPPLDQLMGAVPAGILDQACSDDHLLELSLELTNWQTMSPFLGLSEADEEVVLSERNVERQRIDMLRKWRAKFGSSATYRCVCVTTRYTVRCKEPRGSKVHKYWRADPGRDGADCIIICETASRANCNHHASY